MESYDAVIAGGGAAGLSAALVLGRARRRVLVVDRGEPRNRPAQELHGYVSCDGMSPADFLSNARKQLAPYDSVELTEGLVDDIHPNGNGFSIVTGTGTVSARSVILATGVYDVLPDVGGLRELWGKSVFTCPYCDGWEVRDRKLAAWGTTRSGVELARELYQWSRDLLVCSDLHTPLSDDERAWMRQCDVRVKETPIRRLVSENGALSHIEFEDGETIERDALFLCVPLAQNSDLAEKLGCNLTIQGRIDVDNEYRTNVKKCYAAGDAVTHLHQIVFAAASGARAAISLNEDLMGER